MTDYMTSFAFAGSVSVLSLMAVPAVADIIHADDVIAQFSLCVGNDCVNGENFGSDTIRLKENNLRIHFDDTSSSGSFPNVDWRITANDQANGGDNYFSVSDATNNRTIFKLESNAPSNSLYVSSEGRVATGTSSPVLDFHAVNGNTPGLRLEQDGSSGFASRIWDIAANETNFFVRDVNDGSNLPFRIRAGAGNNAMYIGDDGSVGIGTQSPDEKLHVESGNIFARNSDKVNITLDNTSDTSPDFRIQLKDSVRFSYVGSGAIEMELDTSGNLKLAGGLVTTGGGGACTDADPCDAVFDPAVYEVPSIESHAQAMWEGGYLPAVGPTRRDEPINMTVKMLRMLNELEHAHIYIEQLHHRVASLESRVDGVVKQ
ncbi:hypothetical protein [Salipiger abyssi]|uniref:Peptidase S74 domain-containing protein n=1 Tax=Salipiger abyssi TaxID=1250539 RepID=A0A1P8UXD1_9RHOB|nr:hypothetical protein [Salipiger abyssi]APZ54049.1 hypothetical protein Ga0080574_TMP3715 [Salipiger abyssi]